MPADPNQPPASASNDAHTPSVLTSAVVLTPGSRLSVKTRTGSDGALATASACFDPVTQQTCAFVLANHGKYRCLPDEQSFEGPYADSARTKRVFQLLCPQRACLSLSALE